MPDAGTGKSEEDSVAHLVVTQSGDDLHRAIRARQRPARRTLRTRRAWSASTHQTARRGCRSRRSRIQASGCRTSGTVPDRRSPGALRVTAPARTRTGVAGAAVGVVVRAAAATRPCAIVGAAPESSDPP